MIRGSFHLALTAALAAALSCAPAIAAAQADPASARPASAVRVLRVGASGDYPPFSSYSASGAEADASETGPAVEPGAAKGSWSGFDVEVARRFAAGHGYRLEFVRFRWPDLTRDLAAGRFDVAMSGVTVRADRSVIGRFTVPVAETQAVALSWKGTGLTVARQLNRNERRIAVNAGGYLEGVARRNFPFAQIIALPSNEAARMALLDRSTDAVVTDNIEEKQWTAGISGVVRIGPLSNDNKAYLVRADREDLAAQLDSWLLARERDGLLPRLRAALLGQDAAASALPLTALIAAVRERMSLMPLVWAAKQEAGLPIRDEAQEARVLDSGVAATVEAARAASRPPPDAERVRAFYRALIEAGRDMQQHLDEQSKAKSRPNPPRTQPAEQAATAPSAPAPQKAEPPATAPSAPAPQKAEPPATAPSAPAPQTAGQPSTAAQQEAGQPPAAPAASDSAEEEAAARLAREAAAREAQEASEAAMQKLPATPQPQPQRQNVPTYDLQTEIRPAVARVNVKLARLIVALDTPLTIESVQRQLRVALGEYRLRASHLEAISKSIAALSVR